MATRSVLFKEEKVRKVLSMLAMVFLVLSLVACGGEAATPVPATPTTAAAGTEPTATSAAGATDATPTTAMAAETPTTAAMAGETPSASASGVMTDVSLSAIKARGKLIVGVKYDVPTFGFLNPESNQVEGFDADMGRAVAERIFGDPNAIEFKEAKSANRIPYLNDGVVDVIFSTMTANEERSQQIDFSDCYYVAGQSLLVPVDSTITSINDLAGKTVGTVTGSTSEKNIRAKAPEAKVELFSAYSEAVQAMESGRVDTVTTDDIILYGFQRQNPDKFKVVGGQFTIEPYAAGVKKGNTELLNEVDAAIRDLKSTGKWAEIYKTWIPVETAPEVPPQDWREVNQLTAQGGTPGAGTTPTEAAPAATPSPANQ
jgi:aspartate/glutamate/glutamine transport system substrate-binding protein